MPQKRHSCPTTNHKWRGQGQAISGLDLDAATGLRVFIAQYKWRPCRIMQSKLLALKIQSLSVSQAQVASLARIREGDLNNYLRGMFSLSNDKFLRLRDVLDDLEKLVQLASPFEITFRDGTQTRKLIEMLHDSEFQWLEKAKAQHEQTNY
jgi:hypothetical protein